MGSLIGGLSNSSLGVPVNEQNESGFTVVQAMWAMAITLVLVTWFANLFVHRYAQGAIRQATDEAAHAWAASGGTPADCQAAAQGVLDELLSGTLRNGITITCSIVGNTVRVSAVGTMEALPPLPPAQVNQTSVVVIEPENDLTAP